MMSHRNVVSIYDVNVREDIKYIVMEYIEGITLRNYMTKRGRLTLREIISYTEQILLCEQEESLWAFAPSIYPSSSLLAVMIFDGDAFSTAEILCLITGKFILHC